MQLTTKAKKILRFTKDFLRENWILCLLLIIVEAVRFIPGAGEFYSTTIYPIVSFVLSWVSSIVPFSIGEYITIGIYLFFILYTIISLIRKKSITCTLKKMVLAEGWLVVWINISFFGIYYRNSLMARVQAKPIEGNKEEFVDFLKDYTNNLNANYVRVDSIDKEVILSEIQASFNKLPPKCGLAKAYSFQRPKIITFNRINSLEGVLGYNSPWLNEIHVNPDLLPIQHAPVLAHEISHLLGVSSEMEANFWGYAICRKSKYKEVRYSAYFFILPYVRIYAKGILSEQEYSKWMASINNNILSDLKHKEDYWKALNNKTIKKIHTKMYDLHQKSKGFKYGASYGGVVWMIIAMQKNGETFS